MRLLKRSPRRQPRREKARGSGQRRPARKLSRYPALRGVGRGDAVALVVGLGNPGREYERNRHNAGHMAADALLKQSELLSEGESSEGHLALVRAGGRKCLILKPWTFMNDSGRAIMPVLKYYGLGPEELVVVHDDIDIQLGEVREKRGGGSGGHRGLASVLQALGDDDFFRVRIGVGRPPAGVDPADYVLSDFRPEERDIATEASGKAADMALDVVVRLEEGSGHGPRD